MRHTIGLLLVCAGLPGLAHAQPVEPLPVYGTQLDVDVSGNLFVLDSHSATLTLYDASMHKIATAGGPGWENGRFDQPAGIWARNGLDVFVADYGNHRIQRFDRTLSFISSLSTRDAEDPSVRFGYPSSVALSRLGELYLCDTEDSRIMKVNASNQVELSFGGFGGGEGRLEHPLRLELGANDWVYVLDPPHVLIFDAFGNYLTRLPEGLLAHPTLLFADARGSMVLEGDSLLFFDLAQHPVLVAGVETITGAKSASVTSAVIAGDKLYLLCSDGLFIVPDPRVSDKR